MNSTSQTYEKQAETGKRMSWVDSAARLAPRVGARGVTMRGRAESDGATGLWRRLSGRHVRERVWANSMW